MRSNITILATLAALLLTATCCSNDSEGNKPLPEAKPIVLKADYKAKMSTSRSFAIDLFKATLADSKGANIFISPYSVNAALGMAWNGAAGETAKEVQQVLGNSGYTSEQINDYAKSLTDALVAVDPSTELKIANSVWADNTTPFKPTFVEVNKTWYNAEVKNVDFSKQETLNEIDRWCKQNTGNKIERITDGMTADTKFALINAIYFKARWRQKFDGAKTRSETFTNQDGSVVKVQMMNQVEGLYYSDDDSDWKMLSLPYGNKAFSMLILMPYANEPLDKKVELLTADKYYELFNTLRIYNVTVKLPKFKAEYKYSLNESILPSMGMKQLFDPRQANLSQMCDVPMYVNMVMHKTYIDVYEDGTEAAAATSVSGEMTSPGPGVPITFFVDRPFIYSIVENSTGTILFMGRVNRF